MGNKQSKAIKAAMYTDELDISYQDITLIPPQIVSLHNIVLLNLAGNKIRTLDGFAIQRLERLQTLDLSGNQISRFPIAITELKRLKILNLSFNSIKGIPKEISALVELQKLSISGNGIKELPDEIGNLSKLQELRADKNEMMDLPLTLSKLKLTIVAFQGNPWIRIPSVIPKIIGPEEIDLSDGCLTELDSETVLEFTKNPRIKVLNLSKNKLRKVPPELTELYTLREINLQANPLREWPAKVKSMMNLTYNFEEEMKTQLWVK